MKKIFIVVLILTAGFAYAESSWLEVEWAFQLGWIKEGAISFYTTNKIEGMTPFNGVFSINCLVFSMFKFGGSWINGFTNTETTYFFPTDMTYSFNFGFEPVKGISINCEHFCYHPLATFLEKENGIPTVEGGYTRVFFEIKSKIIY
jgi:hypothetical protein